MNLLLEVRPPFILICVTNTRLMAETGMWTSSYRNICGIILATTRRSRAKPKWLRPQPLFFLLFPLFPLFQLFRLCAIIYWGRAWSAHSINLNNTVNYNRRQMSDSPDRKRSFSRPRWIRLISTWPFKSSIKSSKPSGKLGQKASLRVRCVHFDGRIRLTEDSLHGKWAGISCHGPIFDCSHLRIEKASSAVKINGSKLECISFGLL